jgi:hypothetical protein
MIETKLTPMYSENFFSRSTLGGEDPVSQELKPRLEITLDASISTDVTPARTRAFLMAIPMAFRKLTFMPQILPIKSTFKIYFLRKGLPSSFFLRP